MSKSKNTRLAEALKQPAVETTVARSKFVQAFRLGGVEIDIRQRPQSSYPDLVFVVRNQSEHERDREFRLDHLGSLAKLIDIALWWYFRDDDAS